MAETKVTTASLRFPGAPCWAIGYGQLAVWSCDDITILTRIGKRYLCRVIYGAEGYKITFYTWLPKKWLRRKSEAKA